ncbi:hypothetical protein SDC9_85934 [bioreactor metagenome]|uniref:Uncharacterized protein n=1 Tax=bioreactor metagenome TaxID=1076179 RepID=A0A644ZHL1_9ZZZZ
MGEGALSVDQGLAEIIRTFQAAVSTQRKKAQPELSPFHPLSPKFWAKAKRKDFHLDAICPSGQQMPYLMDNNHDRNTHQANEILHQDGSYVCHRCLLAISRAFASRARI